MEASWRANKSSFQNLVYLHCVLWVIQPETRVGVSGAGMEREPRDNV